MLAVRTSLQAGSWTIQYHQRRSSDKEQLLCVKCTGHSPAWSSFLGKRVERRLAGAAWKKLVHSPLRRGIGARAGPLQELLHNQALMTTAGSCILAQLLKPFAAMAQGKPFDIRLAAKSGGLPSAHSTSVTALATAIGIQEGLDDPLFGAAVVMACIVMYDAQGVRYAASKQAEVLNSLIIPQMAGLPPDKAAELLRLARANEAPSAEKELLRQQEESTPSHSHGGAHVGHAQDGLAAQVSSLATAVKDLGGENGVEAGRKKEVKRYVGLEFRRAWRHIPLKEAIGHTKLEVLVGALSGVGLAFISNALLYGTGLVSS